jgi:hypothetical protein
MDLVAALLSLTMEWERRSLRLEKPFEIMRRV